jgi:hypothetical protein
MYNLGATHSGEVGETFYSSKEYNRNGPSPDHGGPILQLLNGSAGAAMRLVDSFDKGSTIRAVLGNSNLEAVRSGSVESLPLSSLVLFDKGGKVLWKAP